MISAKSIYLEKAEGFTQNLPKKLLTFEEYGDEIWKKADEILRAWSWDVGTSYDKTDFVVTFADERVYKGEIDLYHPKNGRTESIADHMREFCLTYSGRKRPSNIPCDQYQELLRIYNPGDKHNFGQFLDSYQIG
jgi:hypothetical protein